MPGHGSPPPDDRANHPQRQVAWGRAANDRAYAEIQSRLPPRPPGFLDKPRFSGGEGYSHPGGRYTRPKMSIREKGQQVAEKIRWELTGHY